MRIQVYQLAACNDFWWGWEECRNYVCPCKGVQVKDIWQISWFPDDIGEFPEEILRSAWWQLGVLLPASSWRASRVYQSLVRTQYDGGGCGTVLKVASAAKRMGFRPQVSVFDLDLTMQCPWIAIAHMKKCLICSPLKQQGLKHWIHSFSIFQNSYLASKVIPMHNQD